MNNFGLPPAGRYDDATLRETAQAAARIDALIGAFAAGFLLGLLIASTAVAA